jgi:NADH-quinone oxidoreductase subunit G
VDGNPDVDLVITTQELARMIKDSGLAFRELEPESLDLPFGFKTGAGILFGNSGGVSEAVIRYVAGNLEGTAQGDAVLEEVRSEEGRREATLKLANGEIRMAVVHGLANARALVNDMRDGKAQFDFIEVMACPGGCIGGAGQPHCEGGNARKRRTQSLRHIDRSMDLHKSQENHYVKEAYEKHLGEPNGPAAHKLLHTHYHSRRRIQGEEILLSDPGQATIPVTVCVGTACYLRGSQELLKTVMRSLEQTGQSAGVDIRATFCSEGCDRGPTVKVNGHVMHHATVEAVLDAIRDAKDGKLAPVAAEACGCGGHAH